MAVSRMQPITEILRALYANRTKSQNMDRSSTEDQRPNQGTNAGQETDDTPETREGEIVAWRSWILVTRCPNIPHRHLHSVTFTEHCWDGPVVHANYMRYLSFGPMSQGSGIYAMKKADPEEDYLEPGDRFTLHNPPYYDEMIGVLGQVALWGIVHEHEYGYRAEHAMVRRLIITRANIEDDGYDADNVADNLRRLYDCDVEVR